MPWGSDCSDPKSVRRPWVGADSPNSGRCAKEIEVASSVICSAGTGSSVVRDMRTFSLCRAENGYTVVAIINSFLGEMHDTFSRRRLVYHVVDRPFD